MYFYKVSNLNNEVIGAITSLDLRYFNTKVNRILCCDEKLAQYICLNDLLYRAAGAIEEPSHLKNKYPEVHVTRISEEEYLELKQQNSNENN